ncbi:MULTISPECIES: amino acid ABC transporter permease [unclassified Streptomyces]|uniref:amino acid ABC transporter permease n=1 Tax=unclassified Streptomyces TaxID=2593676 RepID=UPI0033EA320D
MGEYVYAQSWQRLLDQAGQSGQAGQPGQSRQAGALSLASAGPARGGTSGGSGELKHSAKPWSDAAGTAHALQTDTATAKAKLTAAHAGAEAGTAGLASMAALTSVLTSWEKRLTAVHTECGALEPVLRRTAWAQGEVDAGVKSALAQFSAPAGKGR